MEKKRISVIFATVTLVFVLAGFYLSPKSQTRNQFVQQPNTKKQTIEKRQHHSQKRSKSSIEQSASATQTSFINTIANKFSKESFTRLGKRNLFDIQMKHNGKRQRFAVICHYSENIPSQSITWTNPDELLAFHKEAKAQEGPVFVVIGAGGTPRQPENIFALPLTEVKQAELQSSILSQYETSDVGAHFFASLGNNLMR